MDILDMLMKLGTEKDFADFLNKYARKHPEMRDELVTYLGGKYLVDSKAGEIYSEKFRTVFNFKINVGTIRSPRYATAWKKSSRGVIALIKEGDKLRRQGFANVAAIMVSAFFHSLKDSSPAEVYSEDEAKAINRMCTAADKLLSETLRDENLSEATRKQVLDDLTSLSPTGLSRDLARSGAFYYDSMLLAISKTYDSADTTLARYDELIDNQSDDNERMRYVMRKIDYLERLGRSDEVEALELEYENTEQMKRRKANKLLEEKRYNEALALAKQCLADQKRQRNTDDFFWMHYLFSVYVALGDREKVVELIRKDFIDRGGKMDYYQALKKLVDPKQWKHFLTRMIAETKRHALMSPSLLADIYIEEGDKESLYQFLAFDQQFFRLDMLNKYARYVDKSHAASLLKLYDAELKHLGKYGDPKNYSKVALSMECMLLLDGGQEAAHKLAEMFRSLYHRRPLMLEQIEKF